VQHSSRLTTIKPATLGGLADLGEIWRHRELVGFLALRDLKAHYKQAALGVLWVLLQPLLTMVFFSVLFGLLMGKSRKPTVEGVPYAISTFCALVPWQLFARALSGAGMSLVSSSHIVTKVYFPRLAIPMAPMLSALIDFALAFAVLLGMMIFWGITPTLEVFAIPLFVAFTLLTAFALALWLSALNAIYRDVQHALGFGLQLGMYVSPVVYTSAHVMQNQPDWLRTLYVLNPLNPICEGFRWALLGAAPPDWTLMGVSALLVGVVFVGGLAFFRSVEGLVVDMV